MAEKIIMSRSVQKHDVESNWEKATTFVPKQGEIIVYDKDSTYNYERIKIGDGSTLVNALPFVDDAIKASVEAVDSRVDDVNSRVDSVSTLIGDKLVSTQISEAIANKSDIGHTHDEIYYTESEIDSKLSTKSNTGHTHSAYVNQNAFSNVVVGSTTIAADSTTDTLTLVAGNNITLTPDATNDKVTIAAIDTVYTHPGYTAKNSGLYKVTVDSTGHVSSVAAVTKEDITALGIPSQDTDTTYSAATINTAGLMSAADKIKLNGIATGATKTTVDSALSSTSTNPVQNNVINAALYNLNTLIGDKAVSEQISDAVDNTITGLSVSGQTITYTKSDGSTGTITTQDTNTTYSAGTGLSLSGTTFTNTGVTSVTMVGPAATVTHGDGTTATYKLNGIASTSSTDGRMQCSFSTETDYQQASLVMKYANGSSFNNCWSIDNPDDSGGLRYTWYNESGWAGSSYILHNKNFTDYVTPSAIGAATSGHTHAIDSALSSSSTNPVQNKIVNAAISNLNTLVGDTAVSAQISAAVSNHTQASTTITTGGTEGQILAVNADGTISPNARTIASLGTGATYSLDGTTLTITTL